MSRIAAVLAAILLTIGAPAAADAKPAKAHPVKVKLHTKPLPPAPTPDPHGPGRVHCPRPIPDIPVPCIPAP